MGNWLVTPRDWWPGKSSENHWTVSAESLLAYRHRAWCTNSYCSLVWTIPPLWGKDKTVTSYCWYPAIASNRNCIQARVLSLLPNDPTGELNMLMHKGISTVLVHSRYLVNFTYPPLLSRQCILLVKYLDLETSQAVWVRISPLPILSCGIMDKFLKTCCALVSFSWKWENYHTYFIGFLWRLNYFIEWIKWTSGMLVLLLRCLVTHLMFKWFIHFD